MATKMKSTLEITALGLAQVLGGSYRGELLFHRPRGLVTEQERNYGSY
jgi:hypothetical protein